MVIISFMFDILLSEPVLLGGKGVLAKRVEGLHLFFFFYCLLGLTHLRMESNEKKEVLVFASFEFTQM